MGVFLILNCAFNCNLFSDITIEFGFVNDNICCELIIHSKKFIMKKILIFSSITVMVFCSVGCKKEKKGCIDPKALNRNIEAEVDNGTCDYSTVIFYMSVINPSRPVNVAVNGNNIGTITAQYPGGPGNCIAPGCAIFKFKNGQKIDWVATEPGGVIWTGSVEPSAFYDCIKVRVY